MTDYDKRALADKVKWAMKDKGLSPGDLVNSIGISPTILHHVREATWKGITVKTLKKIGDGLDLKLVVKFE